MTVRPKLSKTKAGFSVYFPWHKKMVTIPSEKEYFRLRTDRNRDIITEEEQNKYRNIRIGIAGLSVGSNILHALVLSGGPKQIKIADFDFIEATNLNRLNANLLDIGKNKAVIAAQKVWELDPFAQIEIWDKGITATTIEKFLTRPRLDFFIDEMDSLDMKLQTHLICKREKIPVLMCTDNGDTVILDVERYDIDPKQKPFFGNAGNLTMKDLSNRHNWLKYSNQIIDVSLMTPRLRSSIKKVQTKKLTGVPQLGTTAGIAGAAISYAIRQIVSGKKLRAGRYLLSLEKNVH